MTSASHSPDSNNTTPSPQKPTNTTAKKGSRGSKSTIVKLLALAGVFFLVIGVINGVMALVSVKNFSQEKGMDVKSGQAYYLMADKEALKAPRCAFFAENDKLINDKVKKIQDLTSSDNKIRDVSLPFVSSKGIYARVEFSEDIPSAHIKCNEGKNYITKRSSGALNSLRWFTVVGIIFGIAMLVGAQFMRIKRSSGK